MESLLNLITGIGVFAISIFIIIVLLIWLFIRSAVASGTKHGILEAYKVINNNSNDIQTKQSMFDHEEKSYITFLLFILIIGIIVACMFL